jgi:cell wall-associated NlpC family hydrolase
MAQQGGGIPGIAIGVASVGGLLVYAGFQGSNPLQALKDISSGSPKGFTEKAAAHQALYEGVGVTSADAAVDSSSFSGASGPHPELVKALGAFANDQYSSARRWQDGYSDCSSFIGKGFKAVGIKPPGASTTSSYLVWKKLKPIAKSDIGAGDLLVSSGHMAMAINNTTAVGQQNARVNVDVGPISSIMYGQSWVALRYTGSVSAGSAAT